jgi:hypothetical protein
VNRWGTRIFVDQTVVDHPFWRLYPDPRERQWASALHGHDRGLTKPPPRGGRRRQPVNWTVTKSDPWWRRPGGGVNPFDKPPDPTKLGAGLVAGGITGIPGLALLSTAISGDTGDKGGKGMTTPTARGDRATPGSAMTTGTTPGGPLDNSSGGGGATGGGGAGGGNSSIGKTQKDMLGSNQDLEQAKQAIAKAVEDAKKGQQSGLQAMRAITKAEQSHQKTAADSHQQEARKRQQTIQKMKREQQEANKKWAQIVKEQADVAQAAGIAQTSGKTLAGQIW